MKIANVFKSVCTFMIVFLVSLSAAIAEESAETLREQDRALSADSGASDMAVSEAAAAPEGGAEPGPLFVGVDDSAVDAFRVDVMTNAFTTAFSGGEVWGSAYDADNDRVLFNDGTTLWEWPVGGAPNLLGTITNAAGSPQSMTGLAWYGGTLYSRRNIAPEAVYTIDMMTLVATIERDYDDGSVDCGGLAADPATGDIYTTNDEGLFCMYGTGMTLVFVGMAVRVKPRVAQAQCPL